MDYESDISVDDVKLLMLVKKTEIEMMQDRGLRIEASYSALYNNILQGNIQAFKTYITRIKDDNPQVSYYQSLKSVYISSSEKYILRVIYIAPPSNQLSISVHQISAIISTIQSIPISVGLEGYSNRIMIITDEGVSSQAIAALDNSRMEYEIFKMRELRFNPTRHILVGKHEKLTQAEVEELCSDISIDNIPSILVEDRISRHYRFKEGDVIRITRTNMSYTSMIPTSVSYRVVRNMVRQS